MLTVIDRSNYLKGLLILARQDRRLAHEEKDFIREVAKKFGFSRDFYEDVLKSLMANRYLTDEPVVFSNKEIAEMFLLDGLEMAFADNDFDEKELVFLREIASANDMDDGEFEKIIVAYKSQRGKIGKNPAQE